MQPALSSLGIVALLACAVNAGSAQKPDSHEDESPRKPAPKWLKIIDQGKNDPRLKGYLTPDGLKVEIVADFPVVRNPVGMTFGDDGTALVLEWVPDEGASFAEQTEMVTYKNGTTRQIVTMKKRARDLVKVLHFDKDKGIFVRAEVVLEDEFPSSILLHDGWIYLSCRGTVRRYRPSKPGGPYDVREVIAQGFCGYRDHQVSGLTLGNDGWLYITSGDDDNVVEGSDGSRAIALHTGAVFRCLPDGSHIQAYSIGYCNPYHDAAFDASFNLFHADSGNGENGKFQSCRLMHVAEECDFGWRLLLGARCCKPDEARAAVNGELPGKLPPLLKTSRGTPGGLLIYHDTRLPETFRGLLYYPDAFRRQISAFRVAPQGSTFEVVEQFELMKSNDPLFSPRQLVLGPDGAMYVVDGRTESDSAGHLGGDGKHGRIYRLSWAGTTDEPALPLRGMDSWARIVKQADDELFKTLTNDEFSDRLRAQRELARRGAKHRPALLKLLEDGSQPLPARIAALGALESLWDDQVKAAFLGLLGDVEPDLCRLAADGLSLLDKPGDPTTQDALVKALGDSNPAVRRAVALALGRLGGPGAAESLVRAFAFDDGKDSYLQDALIRAIERQGKVGIDRLLELADSGDQKATDKVVETFLALRTRPGAEAIPTLLASPHVIAAARASLLRSYMNYLLEPPIELEPIVEYLVRHPSEDPSVKRAGLEALAASWPVKTERARTFLLRMLDEKDTVVQKQAVRALGLEPSGARLVGRHYLQGKLPRELLPDVTDILRRHVDKDAEIAELANQVMRSGTPESRKESDRP